MAEKKKTIITQKINGIVYELMPKTQSDMVYVDTDYKVTLTEKIDELIKLINEKGDTKELEEKVNKILDGSPETMRTFKDVWNYININGDPMSELIKLIKSKQDKEEGKGLSTHDFTDYLYAKLTGDYTKEELDAKFQEFWDYQIQTNTRIAELDAKLTEERNNRITNDKALESKINEVSDNLIIERNNRINNDENLDSRITEVADDLTMERNNRISNDKALDAKISAQGGDLATETAERISSDDKLDDRLRHHNTYMGTTVPTEADEVEDNNTWYQVVSEDS